MTFVKNMKLVFSVFRFSFVHNICYKVISCSLGVLHFDVWSEKVSELDSTNGKVYNGWILFNKKCVFGKPEMEKYYSFDLRFYW